MNKIITSFLITFIAGISTIIGIIPIFINHKYKNIIIQLSLSFAAGIMITISLLSLILESINYLDKNITIITILLVLIFINIGIILSMFINKIISNYNNKYKNNNLYKLGIISVIALVLHNIPEGITTFITTSNNLKLGIILSIAIALHNIPEGISIAVPIYYSTNSYKLAFIYTFIAGFSELIGGIISYLFLSQFINNFILSFIIGMTAGIMLHISIFELIPNSFTTNNKLLTILGLIIGSIIMLICIYFFHI